MPRTPTINASQASTFDTKGKYRIRKGSWPLRIEYNDTTWWLDLDSRPRGGRLYETHNGKKAINVVHAPATRPKLINVKPGQCSGFKLKGKGGCFATEASSIGIKPNEWPKFVRHAGTLLRLVPLNKLGPSSRHRFKQHGVREYFNKSAQLTLIVSNR